LVRIEYIDDHADSNEGSDQNDISHLDFLSSRQL
jgi:hypothetical protein